MMWEPITKAPKDGRWILAWYGEELHNSQSAFSVVRFYSGEWRNDEGDRCMAEPDMWMPLPGEPNR